MAIIMKKTILLAILGGALAAPFTPFRRDKVLLELDHSSATFYYDLTNQMCDATAGSARWAVTSGINNGVPTCQGSVAKSLADIGTNRIVAMDVSKLTSDMSQWCGKEVVITDASGKKFEFSEGPLYIWDGCEACVTSPHVDLSAKAFTELSGGTCGNNPSGLTIQIMDDSVVSAVAGNTAGGAVSGGNDKDRASASSSPSPLPSPSPASSASRAASVQSAPAQSSATVASASSSLANNKQLAAAPVGSDDSSGKAHASSGSLITQSTPASSSGPSASAASGPNASAASSPITSAGPAASSSSSACTYGAWQCAGQNIEVCNYTSNTSLAWQSVGACPTACKSEGSQVWCE